MDNDTKMKWAIIYVTRSGNCKKLAEELANQTNGDVYEIIDLVDRSGLGGFLKGGAQATWGELTSIQSPEIDYNAYTTVILVMPMWAFTICPPMKTFLSLHRENLLKLQIGLVISHLGTSTKKMVANFQKDFGIVKASTSIKEKISSQDKTALLASFIQDMEMNGIEGKS